VIANHDRYGKINVSVPHAACGAHLTKNWRFLIEHNEFSPPPTLENPLPNIKLTEFLVGVNWKEFRDRLASMSPQEKTAELSVVAEMIAAANGYVYDDKVSSENRTSNHLRRIFRFERGNILVFLSLDFESPSGAFEVCDRNGMHFGEVLFSGQWNKVADAGGHHNIRV
jgi:hypothetical protein